VRHPALRKLRRLHRRALLRRLSRALKTPTGAIMAIIVLCFLVMVIGNSIFTAMSTDGVSRTKLLSIVLDAAPLGLLAMTCFSVFTSAGDNVISFTPSEVDFLFPGPFTRKQLLVHKLTSTIKGNAAVSVFLSFVSAAMAPWWLSAFCAIFFSIMFIHSLTLVFSLIGQTVKSATFSIARKAVAGLMIALGGMAAASTVANLSAPSLSVAFRLFVDSTAGTILLAPYHPFVELFRSVAWLDAAFWASICGGIDIALLALALRLDANYLESAANATQRMDKLRQRAARSGGGALVTGSMKTASWSVPRLPAINGFGSCTWLQLACGLRGSRAFLFFLSLVVVFWGIVVIALGRNISANKLIGISIGALSYLSFLLSMNPPLGFRSCGEQIPWLKTMPLSEFAIGFGQTFGIALIISALQWLLVAILFAGLTPSVWFIWAGAIALPLNFFMFGMDNLTFLLFPSQLKSGAPGDIVVMGRMMFQSLIKMIAMVSVAIPIGLIGAIFWIPTRSIHAFPASALVTLIGADIGLVFLIAFAFRRFDPSMHKIAN
jgi:hypothetical protein